MHQDHNASPFNALPGAVVLIAGAMFGVELMFLAAKTGLIGNTRGGEDWRIWAVQSFAYSGDVQDRMLRLRTFPPEHLLRYIAYPFVHGAFTHMIFAAVFTLALGKMVGEVFSNLVVVVVFFAAAILGVLVFGLVLNDPRPIYGGFPGAYGLIGAYTFILWLGLGRAGQNQLQAFTLIGALIAYQLIFGLILGSTNEWVAEMTGFAVGFGLTALLVPGGWQRVLAQLRKR